MRFISARHECRSFGKLGRQFIAIAGGHAPRYHHRSLSLLHFRQIERFEHRLDALFGSSLDERAGVHDDDIGGCGIIAQSEPGIRQACTHLLGIDLVLRAAQRA